VLINGGTRPPNNFPHVLIGNQATRLELGAERAIQSVVIWWLNLMSDADKESQVIGSITVTGDCFLIQTSAPVPSAWQDRTSSIEHPRFGHAR